MSKKQSIVYKKLLKTFVHKNDLFKVYICSSSCFVYDVDRCDDELVGGKNASTPPSGEYVRVAGTISLVQLPC